MTGLRAEGLGFGVWGLGFRVSVFRRLCDRLPRAEGRQPLLPRAGRPGDSSV